MTASRVRVVRASPGLVWRALDGDDIVGAASAFLRPDGRWFVHLDLCRDDSYEPLLAAVGRQFDPATYLVAVEVASGDYVGLARVWKRPGKPRLGLIGVLGPHRQQGLARILLARVFRVLHQRGQAEVAAEIDDTNAPSRALLLPLGAKAVGGFVEFIRPHGAAH